MRDISISVFAYPKLEWDAFWNTEGLFLASFSPFLGFPRGSSYEPQSLATNRPNPPDVSWKSIWEQPDHRQRGKQEKTVSHASHVSHYLLSPFLQHVTYCSGISLLLSAVEETGLTADGNEWQEMASTCLQLPAKEPSTGEALRACAFLWPSLFVKHPQEKKVSVTSHHCPIKCMQGKKHWGFFPKEYMSNLKANLQMGVLSILLEINI